MRTIILCFFAFAATAPAQSPIVDPERTEYTIIQAPSNAKVTLVFLGDGFAFYEQDLFDQKVKEMVKELSTVEPYQSNMNLFDIFQLNVLSQETGADHPLEGIKRHSAFRSSFGKNVERYLISPNIREIGTLVYSVLPNRHQRDMFVVILVNDALAGGAASGPFVWTSIRRGSPRVLTHELGHAIGFLDDEYECLKCDGTDNGLINYDTLTSCNVTERERGDPGKWDPQRGMYLGAAGFAKGAWRSQENCHMRTLKEGFCPVCRAALKLRFDEIRSGTQYSGQCQAPATTTLDVGLEKPSK